MNSNTGTIVATFSGNTSNSLKCSSAYLKANNSSANTNTNIGARNLSVIPDHAKLPLPLGKITVTTPLCIGSKSTKIQERQE